MREGRLKSQALLRLFPGRVWKAVTGEGSLHRTPGKGPSLPNPYFRGTKEEEEEEEVAPSE